MRPVLFNQPAFVERVFDALEVAFADSPLKTSGAPVRSAYENAVLQWFTSFGRRALSVFEQGYLGA